ncbi:MAG: hypothetical protein KF680_00510, partial [Cryobacterium sp.]|nr:hypothetical protein [Cryobacterium sp.]
MARREPESTGLWPRSRAPFWNSAIRLLLAPAMLTSVLVGPANVALGAEPPPFVGPPALTLVTLSTPATDAAPAAPDDPAPTPPALPPADVPVVIYITTQVPAAAPPPGGMSNCVLKNVDTGTPAESGDGSSSSSSSSSSSTLVCGPGTVGPTTIGNQPNQPGGGDTTDPGTDDPGTDDPDTGENPSNPPTGDGDDPNSDEGDSTPEGETQPAFVGTPILLSAGGLHAELDDVELPTGEVDEPDGEGDEGQESGEPAADDPPADPPLSGLMFSPMSEGDEGDEGEDPTPFIVSLPGSTEVLVYLDGDDLVVGSERRPLAEVLSVTITSPGGSRIVIDASVLGLGIPFNIDGAAGDTLVVAASGVEWMLGATSGSGSVHVGGTLAVTYTGIVAIEADGPNATLVGPAGQTGEVVWEITGAGEGTVGVISFDGFATLRGAASSDDTFIVRSGGSIDHVDGGAGGMDSLELHASGGEVLSIPSGSDSGTITFEGATVSYAGLEPILVTGADDAIVTTTTPDDVIEVSQDSLTGQIRVESTIGSMETVTVEIPTALLEIIASAPGVTITVIGDLLLPGVTLRLVAAYIVIDGVTIDLRHVDGDGDLVLAAGMADDSIAELTVTDAELFAGDIELSSTATVSPGTDATVSVTARAETVLSGQTVIEASGSVLVSSRVSLEVTAIAEPVGVGSTGADVAVAIATVASSAATRLEDSTMITAAGDARIEAVNASSVSVIADASGADAGGSIATALVTASARAELSDDITVAAQRLSVLADTDVAVSASATASPGGADQNDESPTDSTGGHADTPDGTVTVAGAISLVELTQSALATIASSVVLTATHSDGVTVRAISRGGTSSTADGSPVVSGADGVGVAVAVNLVTVTTQVSVSGGTFVTPALLVQAVTAPDLIASANEYRASAVSGASTGSGSATASVNVAGALAITIATISTIARVLGDVVLVDPDGVDPAVTDLTIGTHSAKAAVATANPAAPVGDVTTGIGASVALTVIDDATTSELGDDATVTGLADLTVAANSRSEANTEAIGGSTSTGVAIAGATAITVSTVSTLSRIGTGGTLLVHGDLLIAADQNAPVTTTARGAAEAGDAAVGLALALAIVDHRVRATTERDVTADGTIVIRVTGASATTTVAEASAGGSPEDSNDPVQATAADQMGGAHDFAADASGTSPPALPAPSTPSGAVSVAAAIAVTLHTSVADASVSGVHLVASGVTISASHHDFADTTASGLPADRGPPGSSIAAGIAITHANVSITAALGAGTTIETDALTLEAQLGSTTASGDPATEHWFAATSIAGAGTGGTLGLAGSLAILIVELDTSAWVSGSASIDLDRDGDAVGGTLTVFSHSVAYSLAQATMAADSGGSTIGVGAGVGVAIVTHTTTAEVDDSATISGLGDADILALSYDDTGSLAEGAAAGTSVSVAPFIATTIVTVQTIARLGTGALLEASGSVSIGAVQEASAWSTAEAATQTASGAAIGAGIALTVSTHTARAALARSVDVGEDLTIVVAGVSGAAALATASSSGAEESTGAAGEDGDGVDTAVADQRRHAETLGNVTPDPSQSSPSASTSAGGVDVAAAVAVVVASSLSEALIEPSAVSVIVGGALTAQAIGFGMAGSSADARAAGGGAGTIGAAVSVTSVQAATRVLLPVGTAIVAGSADLGAWSLRDFAVSANSGASAGTISVAGSVAVLLADLETTVELASDVTLSGDLVVGAESDTWSYVSALPADGTGGSSVGVGASVAIAVVDETTRAEIGDGAQLNGVENLYLEAFAYHTLTVEAEMGSTGGGVTLTPAVATAHVTLRTLARLGDGVGISVSGDLEVTAYQDVAVSAFAGASAAGGSIGVGLALGLVIAQTSVVAALGRNIDSAAGVLLSAAGAVALQAEGTASAAGAPGETSGGAEGDGVDQQVAAERNHASGLADSSPSADTPDAATSAGGVSVAAAVGVIVAEVRSEALVEAGVTAIAATGAVTIESSANTDAHSWADGSATEGTSLGIGAAVAILSIDVVNRVILPVVVTVTAESLTIAARVTDVGGDAESSMGASAVSGAGGGSVSVAGSVALAFVTQTTSAQLLGTAQLTGDLTVEAESYLSISVSALPAEIPGSGAVGESVGIGASVAIAIVSDTTEALIGSGSSATASSLRVSATTTSYVFVSARIGASGGDVGVAPAVATALVTVVTSATIASGSLLELDELILSAVQDAATIAEASAGAESANAAVGIALALAIATHSTTASLARAVTVTGDASITASGTSSVSADATASSAGAASGGASVDQQVADERGHASGLADSSTPTSPDAPSAATSEGVLGAAAAVGVVVATVTVTASVASGASITADGTVHIAALTEANASSSGEGSAAGGASVAIGAGVALTLTTVRTTATIASGAAVTAASITIEAATPAGLSSDVSAKATSGAAGEVSIAGSVAIALIDRQTVAELAGTATIVGGGELRIEATSLISAAVEAVPAEDGALGSGSVGIGASFALVILDETTRAEIANGAIVAGAHDVTLLAEAVTDVSSTATMGAGSASVAVSPAVAITLSTVTASARIGTGAVLDVTGSVEIGATLTASAASTAGASASAGTAAVGIGLGLTIAQHSAIAELARNADVDGDLTLSATAVSSVTAAGEASAAGAPEATSADSMPDTPGGPTGVDKQVANQRGHADQVAGDRDLADSGTASSPSAETSEGPVAVAAAVGVAISTVTARTIIAPTVSLLRADGTVTLATAANADVASVADGSATGGTAAVGAGVALSLATLHNEAILPGTVSVEAGSLVLRAGTADDGTGDMASTVTAHATSGAATPADGTLSIAGSVAIVIVDHRTTAELRGGAALAGGDLTVEAVASTAATASALPAGDGAVGGSVGIGAAVALVVLDVATGAAIGNGVGVTGADSISVSATTESAAHAEAKMGAAATGVALAPSVAIVRSTVTTLATLGTGILSLDGDLSIEATQTALASAVAGASTTGAGTAAVGIALGLTIAEHRAAATLARNVSAGGDVRLAATSVSSAAATGEASAEGAPEDDGSSPSVDDQVADQRGFSDDVASKNGLSGPSSAEAPNAETSDGSIAVAAAVGVVISTVTAETVITAAVTSITAEGTVTLATTAAADASSTADGSATGGGTAAIGAGVALTLSTLRNLAIVPNTVSITASGLTVSATAAADGGDDLSTVSAAAASGAAGDVSVAGSVAIALVDHETLATVRGSVALGGGDLTVTAESKLSVTVAALPVGDDIGASSVGVGISFALAIVDATTTASVVNGVLITGLGNASLDASSLATTRVEARMGTKVTGSVAATPAIAIALSTVTAEASVGTGALQTLSGSLSIIANLDASASAIADAEAVGATTAAIGIALGLTIAKHTATAQLARNVNAAQDVTLRATGISAVVAEGTASAGGAPAETPEDSDPDADGASGVDKKVGDQRNHANQVAGSRGLADSGDAKAPKAETSDDSVAVAAAIGVAISTVTVRTIITANVSTIVAGGTVTLASAANADVSSGGDGSATDGGTAAIGAGVALSLSRVVNEAIIPGTLSVTANSLRLFATVADNGADQTATVTAAASAGAAGGVSVAGSVAIAIIDQDTLAAVYGTVLLTGGDLLITARSALESMVTALPGLDGASGDSVGIGIAFALTILDDDTQALIGNGVSVMGARDIVVSAAAETTATSEARMGAAATDSGGVAVTPAVAITLSNVSTSARIGTSTATLVVLRDLVLTADQNASASAIAGASATAGQAAIGVGLALTIAPHGALATLARNATALRDILLTAVSMSAASASATASAAGSPPESGTPETPDSEGRTGVDKQVATQQSHADKVAGDNGVANSGGADAPAAETSDGAVAVAAAVGVVISTITVEAGVTADVTLLVAGSTVELASSANADAASSADGSATNGGTAAIGAGVAITLATVTNRAIVPAWLTVHAENLILSATVASSGADHTATVSAAAVSGAAGGVSVAGSVALAIIDQDTLAGVYGTVVLTGGDLVIIAASDLDVTVSALPADGGVSGTDVGVGISFALTLVTDDVLAVIADGRSVTGARNVELSASALTVAITTARMGAKATGVAVTPAIAITISNVTTSARIGTGALDGDGQPVPLETSGSVSIIASQDASASSIADAEAAAGGDAAVGFGLGLTIVNHGATATLARNLIVGVDVTLRATSRSVAAAAGSASASGAPPDDGSGSDVNSTAADQRGYADTVSTRNGGTGSGTAQPADAETSDGTVTVAAAIAIVVSTVVAQAEITSDVTSIIAGGTVTLASSANSDATTNADGSATDVSGTDGQKAAIGAAVAISVSNVENLALVPAWLTIEAHSLVVSATVTEVGSDTSSTVSAESAAGAAGGVSVAGSVAIVVVNQETRAAVEGVVVLSGGDALIEAASALTSTAKALPVGVGSSSTGDVGVGVSFALNLIWDDTSAELAQGAVLTGAHDLTMTAGARVDAETEARMGAAVSDGGSAAVAPAIAVTVSDVTTWVSLGALSDANLIEISGSLVANATQRTSTLTTAGASAAGGSSASVGVALALTLANHTVRSSTDRNVTAGGGIEFGAFGSSHNEATAEASASGAPSQTANNGQTSSTSGGSVADKLTTQRNHANSTSSSNGGKGVRNASSNPSPASSDGEVSVAAAIALTIADVSATAQLPSGLTLIAGGAVALRSSQNVDGISTADGTAVHASSAGIGAAIALTVVMLENRATLGENTTVIANGFSAEATMTDVDGDLVHTFTAAASSGAGSTDVSVAGSLALNVVIAVTEVVIPSSATLDAGTGDVVLRAENYRTDTATAKADAGLSSGASVGVGASVAINPIIDNVTRAEIEDGATVTGGHNVTIEALSSDTVVTEVTAGSAGGTAISPAVAVAVVEHKTLARIGTSTDGAWTVTGSILVRAEHTGSTTSSGNATAAGDGVAVGAVIVVNVILIDTLADTGRSLTAGGSITLAARTVTSGSAEAQASAEGKSTSTAGGSNSDQQAQHQLNNTPATSGKTSALPSSSTQVNNANGQASSQGGQGSDGVGVGAAVTVNWMIVRTIAEIPANLAIVAGGTVGVLAENGTSATAKATGTTLKLNSTNIGAAIALNVVDLEARGSIGTDVSITAGGDVTVTAQTPSGLRNDFVAWAVSAAGGNGQASVAGSVAVQVLLLHNEASIAEGVTIVTDGGLALRASNPMGLQSIAAAGGLSLSGNGVGAAIVVNVIESDTIARIASSFANPTTVDTRGAIELRAETSLVALAVDVLPIAVPNFTSIALAGGAGGGTIGIGGSLIVDVVSHNAHATIGDAASINVNTGAQSGQSLALIATNDSEYVELAGALGLTTGSAGVGFALVLGIHNKDTRASIGDGVTALVGGDVTLRAEASESFTLIAAGAAAAGTAGVTGSFIVLIINQGDSEPGTRAIIGGGQANPTTVRADGNMTLNAADLVGSSWLVAGGVAVGGTAGVGVSAVVLVRTGIVDAGIAAYDVIDSKGATGLSITATQSADFDLTAVAGAVGGTAGVAGSASVAVHSNTTHARIDRGARVNEDNVGASATQGVALAARDDTISSGKAGALALGGTAGVGVGADVQVITKDTRAWIAPGVELAANGNVTVDATSTEKVLSISAGGAGSGTVGVAVNASVSVLTITTQASIGEQCATSTATTTACASSRTTVHAGGSVRVAALAQLELDVIAGNIAVGGVVGVGAAAAVPVVIRSTTSFIGDNSIVVALGMLGSGIRVHTGGFEVVAIDTRFTPATAIQGDGVTIELGYEHGLRDGQTVLYDAGGGAAIGGLTDGESYVVHVISATRVQLSPVGGGAVISLTAPGDGGESHRLVDTLSASLPQSTAPYFDPSKAGAVAGTVVTLPYSHDLVTGDAVIYSSGGGAAIGGLVDGGTYYVTVVGGTLRLSETKGGPFIVLDASVATGRAHSIVAQGDQPSPPAEATSGLRTVTVNAEDGFVGISVTANSSADIAGVGVSAGVGGTVGVGVSGSVNVVEDATLAFVGRIAVLEAGSPGAFASVLVSAGHDLSLLMVSGSAAGAGVAGVGVSATVGVIDIDTDAEIRAGASVTATADVVVTAAGAESLVAVAASLAGGGIAGVAGAVAVIVLNVHSYATIASATTVYGGGSVIVNASDDTTIIAVAGGAAGGFVGVGVGVGVTVGTKDTQASIAAGSTVDAAANAPARTDVLSGAFGTAGWNSFGLRPGFRGLAVQARSTQNVFGLSVALGAGAVGVAGGVTVTVLSVTTRAFIDSTASAVTRVNQASGAGPEQSVSITAANASKTITVAGGVAGGIVGVAGGVDVGVLAVSTHAFVGERAVIAVTKDFALSALASASVTTFGLSAGVGLVGAAGAVSVWAVGTVGDDSYSDGENDANATETDNGSVLDVADDTASGSEEGGFTNILNDAESNTGSKADDRINNAIGGASDSLAASAPGGSQVTASFTSTSLPKGTTARIGEGTVITAGGDVRVSAAERNAYLGVAGAAAGGLVGIGGAVVVANLKSNVDAGIDTLVSISAGGDVQVVAHTFEFTSGKAYAGAAGGITLSGQIVVIDSVATQTAHIDDAAEVTYAGGVVDVDAAADRTVGAHAAGGAIAGVAAGAAIAIVTISGDTRARIGVIQIGAAQISGGIRAAATSILSAPVRVDSVQAGILGGVTGAGAEATIEGATAASFEGTANLSAGATVSAVGRHSATARTFGVTTGIFAAGINFGTADVSRSTTATVPAHASISAGGPILVSADSRNSAIANTSAVGVSGVGIASVTPTATISGATEAKYEGSLLASGSGSVTAVGQNQAKADASLDGAAVLGGGSGIEAR